MHFNGVFEFFIVYLWVSQWVIEHFQNFTHFKILCDTLRKTDRGEVVGGGRDGTRPTWGGVEPAPFIPLPPSLHTTQLTKNWKSSIPCQGIDASEASMPRKHQFLQRHWFLCLPYSAHESLICGGNAPTRSTIVRGYIVYKIREMFRMI